MGKTYVKSVDYSDKELEYRGYLATRLSKAKEQRDSNWAEFDDADYLTVYEDNAKTANSYLRPKDNIDDTRIVTGTTKQKVGTLLSTILNLNLEPNVMAFDKDDMIIDELGEEMENMIEKSRKIEGYDDIRPLIYKEAFDQGTAFVEEQYYAETEITKQISDYKWDGTIKEFWKEKETKCQPECRVNLISGTKVYLGNIREFFMDKQPYVFTIDYISYEEAKAIYGNMERWQYVPKQVQSVLGNVENDDIPYADWTLEALKDGMVEVTKYQDKWKNEYMLMLNGVMMTPVGCPLTIISPSGDYSINKLDVNPISKFFAYSKSIPSDTKVQQEVLDEFLRLMIVKTQQSYKPPMANNTSETLSARNLSPGYITNNVEVERFKPIIEARGVTASEFNVFNLIKELLNEQSIDPTFSGEDAGDITATEFQGRMRQQLKKMGLPLLGVVNFERKMAWLRIYNIIANWTEPIDENIDETKGAIDYIYRQFDIEDEDEYEGKKVSKTIKFEPDLNYDLTEDEYMQESRKVSEQENKYKNKEKRIVYINPKALKSMKFNWYITITPTEKENDALSRVLFVQNIQDAMGIFGSQTLNSPHLMRRFASIIGEDPDKFFKETQAILPQSLASGDSRAVSEIKQPTKVQQPSVNTLSNA